MDIIRLIAIIQMLAGAIIAVISIILCSRSVKQYLKKDLMQWLVSISLVFLGGYMLLIVLWIKRILPAEAFSGGIALICSCLIASMAVLNKAMTKRLQEEIAENATNIQKIDELSLHDQLTHLYNRKGFISIVEQHLKRLRRLGKKAVLFSVGLNNLDAINENSGYKEGDTLLTNIGTLMTSAFRQADVLGRIGDSEFMAFLVDADIEDMETIHKNFQDKLQKYNGKRSSRFKLSVSFGVSNYDPEMNQSANEIIFQASASGKQKKKGQHNKKIPPSENHSCNFTLIVNNMCSMSFPVDIKIYIDGELSVDDIFDTGMQNTWKPFYFNLTNGSHTIQAKSSKGKASLMQEFKIRNTHWATIEYRRDDEAARSLSGILSFHVHDVPLEYGFVRPIKK
jgi:diguanylate cyclase (GGDEF)-like protein